MIKLPLCIKGEHIDGGRLLTKAEARQLARAAYGDRADVVRTEVRSAESM